MIYSSRPRIPGGRAGLSGRDTLESRLPELRETLKCQRDFRRTQLAELNNEFDASLRRNGGVHPGDPTADDASSHALSQVTQQVSAGAFRALADIERALSRMRAGKYGHCCACGGDISLAVLMAIPQTTLCLSCRRVIEGHDGRGDLGRADAPERSHGDAHRDAVPLRGTTPWRSSRRIRPSQQSV